MIIIVEGPDGAGKTTLIQNMFKNAGICSVAEKDTQEFEYEMKKLMHHKSDKIVMYDRSWYSEMVYGKHWRDKPVISLEDMIRLEQIWLNCGGGFIIYCTGDPEVMYNRRQKNTHDENNKDYERYVRVCEEYDKLMLETPHLIPVFKYVYN